MPKIMHNGIQYSGTSENIENTEIDTENSDVLAPESYTELEIIPDKFSIKSLFNKFVDVVKNIRWLKNQTTQLYSEMMHKWNNYNHLNSTIKRITDVPSSNISGDVLYTATSTGYVIINGEFIINKETNVSLAIKDQTKTYYFTFLSRTLVNSGNIITLFPISKGQTIDIQVYGAGCQYIDIIILGYLNHI